MSSQHARFWAKPDELRTRWADAGFVMANSIRKAHPSSMKVTEDDRKYAAEVSISEEEVLKRGLEAKSKEFVRKRNEIYFQA